MVTTTSHILTEDMSDVTGHVDTLESGRNMKTLKKDEAFLLLEVGLKLLCRLLLSSLMSLQTLKVAGVLPPTCSVLIESCDPRSSVRFQPDAKVFDRSRHIVRKCFMLVDASAV